jgi:hypothetical protein
MVAKRVSSLIWIVVLVFVLVWSADAKPVCGPGTKATIESPDQCTGITTHDVLGAMHGLTSPPTTVCKNQIKIQGIPVCQDRISPNECTVVSIAITEHCNQTGTYEFERYWGSRCKVYIFHMSSYMTGCAHTKGKIYDLDPSDSNLNIKFTTNLMWQGGCFCCVFRHLLSDLLAPLSKIKRIDIFKIQRLDRPPIRNDITDGAQYTVLADLFLHLPHWARDHVIDQILFTTSITSISLVDSVGREAEHGWNMWAARMFLNKFATFATIKESTPYFAVKPLQFEHLLSKIPLDPNTNYYHHSMLRLVDESQTAANEVAYNNWRPVNSIPALKGRVPPYCTIPVGDAEAEGVMQQWIAEEVNARCQPYALWIKCQYTRSYEAFVPCQQDLMDTLAEDYAALKGWCNHNLSWADIPSLRIVDVGAAKAFQKQPLLGTDKPISETRRAVPIRLAFLFTIYADSQHVKRLLSLLYGSEHYYLLHIDPVGGTDAFEQEMRQVT